MRLSLVDFFKRMNPVSGDVDSDFLMKTLLFEDEMDALNFMKSCGFTNFNDNIVNLKYRMSPEDWTEKNKIWRQQCRLTFLDQMRGSKPRSYFMKKGIDID